MTLRINRTSYYTPIIHMCEGFEGGGGDSSYSKACVIIKLAVFGDISGDDACAVLAWLST